MRPARGEQPGMDVPQEQLDQWRQFFEHLRVMAEEGTEALGAGNPERVRDLFQDIRDHAVEIGMKLEDAGARPPTPTVLDREAWREV